MLTHNLCLLSKEEQSAIEARKAECLKRWKAGGSQKQIYTQQLKTKTAHQLAIEIMRKSKGRDYVMASLESIVDENLREQVRVECNKIKDNRRG